MAIAEHELTKHCPQCGKRYPDPFLFCPEDAADLIFFSPMEEEAALRKAYFLPLIVGAVLIGVLYAVLRPHDEQPASGAKSNGVVAVAPVSSVPAPNIPASSVTMPAGWRTYQSDALGFSLQYPDTWNIASPARLDAFSTRVEFQSPDKSATILVDVSPAPYGQTALQQWQGMDDKFRATYRDRYQLRELKESTLGNVPAASWEFLIEKKGTRLQKVDIGAVYGGNGYALLGDAPPAAFDGWRSTFEHVRESFQWTSAPR